MKALSIQQPWAWLIAEGYKSVENRSWDTTYRGEFLIHAGKTIDYECYDYLDSIDLDIPVPSPRELQTGGIIGAATLINTVHTCERHLLAQKDNPWFFGPHGFILQNARPIAFRPCKGALGFFTPDYNSLYTEKPPKASKENLATQSNQGALL